MRTLISLPKSPLLCSVVLGQTGEKGVGRGLHFELDTPGVLGADFTSSKIPPGCWARPSLRVR